VRALLATCRDLPDGEPGHEALDDALRVRGIDATWAVWDDESVDWSSADAVAVRSTWDYMDRLDDFLAWAERVDGVLLHGSRVFRWNTDKRYLLELGRAGIPVVPTVLADDEDQVRAALGAGQHVVKPTVGANGLGVTAVRDRRWVPVGTGPWLVQPLVESVATEGEASVFVIGGRVVGQVEKLPAVGEFRVQEEMGGRAREVSVSEEAGDLAARAYAATERLLGLSLDYARVDLLRHDGALVVTEVEVTEPGLYLDVAPGLAEPFAEMLSRAARPAPR
jgi:glutathione synthase/RimK-type ligase-like ATP-grasp enzyme